MESNEARRSSPAMAELLQEYYTAHDRGDLVATRMCLARLLLSKAPSFELPQEAASFTVLRRRVDSPARGFLVGLEPEYAYVIPLKIGLNRVGKNPMFGDYDFSAVTRHVIEARQWLIVFRETEVLVADDHSDNGSYVVPPDSAEIHDPAFPATFSAAPAPPNRIALDWAGNNVVSIQPGTILLNYKTAFALGAMI